MKEATTAPLAAPGGWLAPPRAEAFHGLAGRIVRAVEPETEADPVAILSQLLVAYGNVIGPQARRRVGATRHHANEFVLLVGPSAKGRKGSSWDFVEEILTSIEPGWTASRLHSGMSSGEGLIWQVRDDLTEVDEAGTVVVRERGVEDKRLLVVESEFALVLRVLAREGNTLSALVRSCWDSKTLQTMTKNSPLRATDAHVSVIGHVTADELLRYVNATELANGFINRFMLLAVRRTKLLPEGGSFEAIDWADLSVELSAAIEHGRTAGELGLTEGARARWAEVYPRLSMEVPGLYGAAIARAEAHVVRLALIYALLDRVDAIDRVHVDAALALWEYAARSARWIFGDTLGDSVADDIWQAVKCATQGLSRAEIRDLFSRNKSAKAINAGLAALERAGRLKREDRTPCSGRGRPAEVWFPILTAM
ncbi:MAG: DUF3987 domain-containing protein [Acidimicrobiales bacterium]